MTKVTGELISIDDSAYDGFQGMTVFGNTRQNLWVNPSGTSNGVTCTANANGSVTLSGTSTSNNIWIGYKQRYVLRPGSTYTLSVDNTLTSGTVFKVEPRDADGAELTKFAIQVTSSQKTATATLPSNTAYVNFLFYSMAPVGTTLSGTYRVMLNEGSTAQPWCPPGLNSVDKLSVVTAGKNLLDIPDAQTIGGYGGPYTFTMDDDGWVSCSKDSDGRSWGYDTANVKMTLPAGEYCASVYFSETSSAHGLRVYTADGTMVCYIEGGSASVSQTFALDAPTEVGVIYKLMAARARVQLELGSTATEYEPPNITTTPIDLQGHTLSSLPDGTRDELHIDGGGNVVLEKRVGVATAPTSAGSWFWGTAGSGIASFTLPAKSTGTQTDMTEIMRCDKLPVRQKSGEASYAMVGTSQGHAKNPAITSTATAATVVGGATYLYKLADTQTIQLGKISLPKLRKKPLVNKIWANGTASGTGFSLAPEIDYEYNQWSTYCDGFRTHGKHSYFDMGCCIAARDTGAPEKKSVTATVPYMSGFYDLSKLYGAIAFEARELMYRFEFVEDSRDELQRKKSQFLEWLSQVHDEEIADDDIPGRHFIGSLSEWEFEEGEEGQSGSLEVTFNCQPFLEADEDSTKTCNAGSNTVTVEGQAVNAYAKTSSGTATIRIGGVTQSVGTTEIRLSVQLQPGDNAVTITGSPVTLRWRELTV